MFYLLECNTQQTMKNLFTLFFLSITISLYAQRDSVYNSIRLDTLMMRSGDTLLVNIIQSTPENITFLYPNEDIHNSEYKNSILKIIYKSGRIEMCSQKLQLPTISGPDDWEKVIITFLDSDIKGLQKVKQLSATSLWGGPLATGKGNLDAQKKLKKKAAKLKASIVLIVDKPNEHATVHGAGVKLIGIAYK